MPDPAAPSFPPVAIAGCGAITAVGAGVAAFLTALRANASGLRPCEVFDSPRFQSNIAGAALPAGDREDPAYQLATAALAEARAEAQSVLSAIAPTRVGLVLATTKANITALERLSENRPCAAAARRHLEGNLLAADLAREHGAGGPVQCVSSACVSGLMALQQGMKMIQRGAAEAMLVVGVDCLSAFVVAGFTALKAIDPTGCRPYDRNRRGLSPGEAGAAIVLVRTDQVAGVPLLIRGAGTSNDANHLTGPSRDGAGLAQAIFAALAAAGLAPKDIEYINAHGTGTAYNDAMEALAWRAVFGGSCPPVSGLKGMLGHTLGAAGVVETIGCVLALRGNFLPGTPRLDDPAEGMPANLVREPRSAGRLKNVLKLNTGFGGINGALILSHG